MDQCIWHRMCGDLITVLRRSLEPQLESIIRALFENLLWPINCATDFGKMYMKEGMPLNGFLEVTVFSDSRFFMMTSSNGSIFRVTGPLRGESTSHRCSPHKSQWRGALMFSFDLRLNKRFNKQSGGRWIVTPSHSLWRHCNVCRAAYTRRKTGDWHLSSIFISGPWWSVWYLFCFWCWWTATLFSTLPPILAEGAGDMWRLSDYIISGCSCLRYASQRCPTHS